MSLLGDIAAALSEGIGGGMIANAQWGIEEDKQAKKEAAENSRLEKTLAKYDADRESREKIYQAQLDDGKEDRKAREKDAAADRELQWRIANLRARGNDGASRGSLKDLEMLDTAITGLDKQIAQETGHLDAADITLQEKAEISTRIKSLASQRANLLNSEDAQRIWASTGSVGAAHRSMFMQDVSDNAQIGDKQKATASPVVPPPRSLDGTRGGGLLTRMSATQQQTNPGGNQGYTSSKDFTNPQVGTSDVTSKYLYQQGGTTAADAANALSKLGYHLPSAY